MAACALIAAGPAAAATTGPTGPTMASQRPARASRDSGPQQGYFKTVLQGSTISNVPVQILAVADGQNPVDGSALIFFQITDPTIVQRGRPGRGHERQPALPR